MSVKTKAKPATGAVAPIDIVVEDSQPVSPEELAKREKEEEKARKKALKIAKNKGKKSKKGIVVFFVLLFALLAGMAALLFFNVFGLRDKYFSGFLSNMPIVSNLLPQQTAESGPYAGYTREELVQQIETLTIQVENDKAAIAKLEENSGKDAKEITRLREYEAKQEQFNQDKDAFDEEIAMGDTKAYQKYYESIKPENKEELYTKAVAANQVSKEVKDYVNTFTNMDEGAAADILANMSATDMNLVVMIMKNLDAETRGGVMGAMSPDIGAAVAKQMAPAE